MRLIMKGITPMSHWPSRGTGLAAVVVAIVAACATVPTTVPASGRPAPSPAVTTPSMVAPTPLTAPVSTIAPTARSEPPAASISVEGGDPVVGQLGTFTWGNGGSDSPWLPGSPIAVGSGERLTVTIADGVGMATWSARRVPAGTSDGSGAVVLGTGGPPIAFDSPPVGAWSVQLAVDFDGGVGSAWYYWLVSVR